MAGVQSREMTTDDVVRIKIDICKNILKSYTCFEALSEMRQHVLASRSGLTFNRQRKTQSGQNKK